MQKVYVVELKKTRKSIIDELFDAYFQVTLNVGEIKAHDRATLEKLITDKVAQKHLDELLEGLTSAENDDARYNVESVYWNTALSTFVRLKLITKKDENRLME